MPTRTTEKNIRQRFWSKVDKRGPDDCWEWQGGLTNPQRGEGYGRFRYLNGQTMHATHVALLLSDIEIPEGMKVLHHCDNPHCVNPKHLYIGTQQDNIDDMRSRGRDNFASPGVSNPASKVTPDLVREIRAKYATGRYSQEKLGKMYGLHQAHVSRIIRRTSWQHIE